MPARIPWNDLPGGTCRELRGLASIALPVRNGKHVGWKHVPQSWGQCREHGWAWYPKEAEKCPLCEWPESRPMGGPEE